MQRFGAAAHRYLLRAPLAEARLLEIEAESGVRLPPDYRDFLLELGDGGAGPYYGLCPLDQPAQLAQLRGAFCPPSAPGEQAPWRGVALLAHLGCGYLAHLVVDEGPHRGEVWLDLGSVAAPRPIAPHFLSFYTAWLQALRLAAWPAAHVEPGVCALAQALSGYLGHVEARQGKPAGSLDAAQLSAALAALGPGAIQIVAETRSFAALAGHPAGPIDRPLDGAIDRAIDRAIEGPIEHPVDPCLACERLLLELAPQGLRREAVAPGAPVGWPGPARAPSS